MKPAMTYRFELAQRDKPQTSNWTYSRCKQISLDAKPRLGIVSSAVKDITGRRDDTGPFDTDLVDHGT